MTASLLLPQDRLSIRILWFDKLWSADPDEDGKVVLDTECRRSTFAGAVLSASQQVLAQYGADGYRNKWVEYDFPSALQAKLKESLA